MTDLMVSLVIVACAIAVALAILLTDYARKKARWQALSAYCQSRGYFLDKRKEPSHVEVRVESDWFTLTSTSISQHYGEHDGIGSSSRERKTVWETRAESAKRARFWLGRIPPATNWDALPDGVKHIAINKLMAEGGMRLQPENVQPLRADGKSAYLLFEQSAGSSGGAAERLIPLLNDWPPQFELAIYSNPAELRIVSANCFVDSAEPLDRFIRLGEAADAH